MGDYDYANARLRAMKSRLFDQRVFAELAALTRLEDLIARLARSTYAHEIEAALARYVGPRVVMEACRLHLAHTYQNLHSLFAVDGARLVSVLLARWDLFNLKTILRGQAAGARPEEILEALVPAGDLDESALRTLVREADPLASVAVLRTWNIGYAQAARSALAEFAVTRDWSAFESALDRIFYARLLAGLDRGAQNDALVRELLVREIDTANVLAALRLRQAGLAPGAVDMAQRFVCGGDLALEWLTALAGAARDEQVLASLHASKFGVALAGLERLDISVLQRALDRDFARFGSAFFARDPLTIATAIGFITAKQVEVANVRLVAHGVALGVGRAEIETDLIMV